MRHTSGSARRYADGTVIVRNADRFDLAPHPGDVPESQSGFLHFGFSTSDPHHIRAMLARLDSNGVPIVESDDDPNSVAFNCLDPYGWRIEVYWEPGHDVAPARTGPTDAGDDRSSTKADDPVLVASSALPRVTERCGQDRRARWRGISWASSTTNPSGSARCTVR